MSKKSRRRKTRAPAVGRCPASRTGLVTAVLLSACVLLAAGYAATRYEPVRLAVGMSPLLSPGVPQQPSLPLAREYVYAGGRLIAIEEAAPVVKPTPTPAGPPPTGLRATARSASSVKLEWVGPAGAVKYVVERRSSLGSEPVEIQTGSNAPRFDDALPQAGNYAYLYRVRAAFPSGYSEYSDRDLATTVVFTDDPITPEDPNTRIKAVHLTELRRAVEAVRALAGVNARAAWKYPDPVSPPKGPRRRIYLEDVRELRERLDEALERLGLRASYPADPPLAREAKVHAAHFEQIRERVK